MTFLIERLAELRQQLDHLSKIKAQVTDKTSLERDLSLHNDVMFSLLVICQSVIDIAGELAGRQGIRYSDYREAVLSLGKLDGFETDLVNRLGLLPGFRNVLVHDYVSLDYERVVEALENMEPVEQFIRIVGNMEGEG